MKKWYRGEWYWDIKRQRLCYLPAGEYEEFALDENLEPAIVIDREAYYDLLDFVRKNEKGVLSTDREEDLKIVHRLIDLMEKKKIE
jgi:hypothetical protein